MILRLPAIVKLILRIIVACAKPTLTFLLSVIHSIPVLTKGILDGYSAYKNYNTRL